MSIDLLFADFDRLIQSAESVHRLRRFILDLAVRGKLAPQDPNDEPASELLKRIAAEKAQLVRLGEIRKSRTEPELSKDLLYNLPSGWAWAPFGLLHYLVRGVTYSKSDVADRHMPDYVAILRANNIGPNLSLNHDEPVFVKRERVSVDQFLSSGDFMIALSSGSKNLVGKAAFVPEDFDEAIGGFCGVIRLFTPQIQDFVRVYLQSNLYRESISAGSRGIGINNLKKESLSNLAFALPPIAEQHRIVAKVDELMALCDRLEAARAERELTRDRLATASLSRLNTPDHYPATFQKHSAFALNNLDPLTTRPNQIKTLRQTILNLAVRGKLAPQDPNDKPASEFLEEIEADRRKRSKSKRGRLPIVPTENQEEESYTIPEIWVWAPLGHITISLDGERIPVSKEERSRRPKLYNYYGASGVIDKIDHYIFDKPLLLIGEDGANLINRSTPIAFIARGKYWVNNHAHVLDGFSEDFLRYIELFINAIDLKPYVTGTAQPKMNQANMNSIPVALPPLAEQHRIVAKVDELMVLCDRLEASLATGDEMRGQFVEALLHDAL